MLLAQPSQINLCSDDISEIRLTEFRIVIRESCLRCCLSLLHGTCSYSSYKYNFDMSCEHSARSGITFIAYSDNGLLGLFLTYLQ